MGLKGGKCRQEINGFENTCFSLCIGARQNNNFLWDVNIQAGKFAKIRKRETFEVHMCSLRHSRREHLEFYFQFYFISQWNAIHSNQRNTRLSFPRFVDCTPIDRHNFKTTFLIKTKSM